MNIRDLKKLIIRCFPGLAGFHVIRYGEITKIQDASGQEKPRTPLAVADVELLDADFIKDERFDKPLKGVRLSTANGNIQSLPQEGDIVMLAFPFWRADQATVLNHLFNSRSLELVKGVLRLCQADKLEMTAKQLVSLGSGEEAAVLGDSLKTKLEAILDVIDSLKLSTYINAGGAPTPIDTSATQITQIPAIKTDLTSILSTKVKVGDQAE
ncbi:MAG: hypothetical protein OEY59_12475 [Deltaproteobacteria bacterium]|nr:hypothetical protein [Deltaproteobacteria bacterium]